MSIKLLVVFFVLNALNVIIQTINTLCTIKCRKVVAALANAITFGFYTVVLVYMVCDDLSTITKAVVVGICNFIGVYVVKLIEERIQKEKLWKVELTIDEQYFPQFSQELKNLNISHNFIQAICGHYAIFNIYCYTKADSKMIRQLAEQFNAKYFVSESKNL